MSAGLMTAGGTAATCLVGWGFGDSLQEVANKDIAKTKAYAHEDCFMELSLDELGNHYPLRLKHTLAELS
jgi:hypothetical protein